MKKVRYEEMLPHEIVERHKKFPVAFIALGVLEWHGEHMAIGNDALKAEKLCELAAEISGGFAFPTIWYGEPLELFEYQYDSGQSGTEIDTNNKIKTMMGYNGSKFNYEYFGTTSEEYVKFYEQLILRILIQMSTLEMKVVCLMPGHYPLHKTLEPIVKKFNDKFKDTKAFIINEMDIRNKYDYVGGDHAAKWETSYLWYLRPDCIDMSIYNERSDDKLIGVVGIDPRNTASIEIGRKACDIIVREMVEKAKEILDA